jgi:hypothetical protein
MATCSDARISFLSIADLAGLMDLVATQSEILQRRSKSVIFNLTPTMSCYLSMLLGSVVFVGESTLCTALDFKNIGKRGVEKFSTPRMLISSVLRLGMDFFVNFLPPDCLPRSTSR